MRRPPHYYGTRQRGFICPLGKKNLNYYGIRITMGQVLHFLKGNIRLLRYSTFGRDKILISQEESLRPSDDRLSTTSVLDLWTGQVPYLPKRNFFSSMRRQLINYFGTRSLDGTSSLSLRRTQSYKEITIHRLLRTRLSEDTKLLTPKRNPSSSRRQLVDYHSTRPMKNQNFHLPRQNYHPQKQRIINYFSTRTTSPFPTKEPLVHKMTRKSTTTILEEMIQESR